jgi:hypothetical protein
MSSGSFGFYRSMGDIGRRERSIMRRSTARGANRPANTRKA